MKIDIITLNAVQNYGSVLQAFATQELLKKHGCDVTIINYVRENVRSENLLKTWSKGNPVKAIIMIPTIIRWKSVYSDFQKNYLNLSDDVYTLEDDFKKYPLKADAYCTGSDQVWNSLWNRGILPCLYLGFVPKSCYKFSFAASFGQQKLSEEEINKTKNYLNEYQKISVREISGITILKDQYNIQDCELIVDPTLCVSGDFWRQYSKSSRYKDKDNYILIYNLNRSKEFDNYAKKLAQITGLKLVRFCTRYDQFYRTGRSVLVPDIFDFVSLIDNAKYVLTDSFHATAFSLNLQTEPVCVYPKHFGARLESILQQTCTLQRHVKNWDDFDIINRPVDFSVVNRILLKEREKASAYIVSVLNDIEQFTSKRWE